MIKLTMGYREAVLGIQNFLNYKAVIIAVLLLVFAGYLGFEAWKSQTAASTPAVAAFDTEQVFTVASVDHKWVLIGKEFPESKITFSVQSTEDKPLTYQVIGTNLTGNLERLSGGVFTSAIDVSNLKPGTYEVVAKLKEIASTPVEFYVSYPLYVTWTLDWEGYDVKDEYLAAIDDIANEHKFPVTHFFNPRIYTSLAISKSRADYLTSWVIERGQTRGDAIGLHLHMFPDLVKAAGVEPLYQPAWGSTLKDGYDILTSAYSYEETVKLLNWSKNIFQENGLETPNMFRAGGWFADEETLKALDDTGFVVDSSGRTKYSFGTNGAEGQWDLTANTHPYHPNIYNQNSADSPTLTLLEFPNNGADSWAYSQDEMYQRFISNFNEEPLAQKQVVTYISHPEWFAKDNPKIKGLFAQTDKYLNSADAGPVIYITLERAYQIWSMRADEF